MAKKSRRDRRGGKRRRTASPLRTKAASVAAPTIAEQAERTAPLTVAPQRKTIDFGEEYRYVYSDLKRIAILAACMFTLLIILSFVIK